MADHPDCKDDIRRLVDQDLAALMSRDDGVDDGDEGDDDFLSSELKSRLQGNSLEHKAILSNATSAIEGCGDVGLDIDEEKDDWARFLSSTASIESRFDNDALQSPRNVLDNASKMTYSHSDPSSTAAINTNDGSIGDNNNCDSNNHINHNSNITIDQPNHSNSSPTNAPMSTASIPSIPSSSASLTLNNSYDQGVSHIEKNEIGSPDKQMSMTYEKMNALVSTQSSSLLSVYATQDGLDIRKEVSELLGDMTKSIEDIFAIANADYLASRSHKNKYQQPVVTIDLTTLPKIIDSADEDGSSSKSKSVLDKLDSIMDSFNDYFSLKYEDVQSRGGTASKDINEGDATSTKAFESFLGDLDDEYDMARQLESEKEKRLQRIININNEIRKFKESSAATTIQTFVRMCKAKSVVEAVRLGIIRQRKLQEELEMKAEQHLFSSENNRSLWLRQEWKHIDRDLEVMEAEDIASAELRRLREHYVEQPIHQSGDNALMPEKDDQSDTNRIDENSSDNAQEEVLVGSMLPVTRPGSSSSQLIVSASNSIESSSQGGQVEDYHNDRIESVVDNKSTINSSSVDSENSKDRENGAVETADRESVLPPLSSTSCSSSNAENAISNIVPSSYINNSISGGKGSLNHAANQGEVGGIQLNRKKNVWGGVVSNNGSVGTSNHSANSISDDTQSNSAVTSENFFVAAVNNNDNNNNNQAEDRVDYDSNEEYEEHEEYNSSEYEISDTRGFTDKHIRRLSNSLFSVDFSVPFNIDSRSTNSKQLRQKEEKEKEKESKTRNSLKSLYHEDGNSSLEDFAHSHIRALSSGYKSNMFVIENVEASVETGDTMRKRGANKQPDELVDVEAVSNSSDHPVITLFATWQNTLKEHIARTYALNSSVEYEMNGNVDCGGNNSGGGGGGRGGARRNRVRIGASNFAEVLEDYMYSFDDKSYFESKGLVPVDEDSYFDMVRNNYSSNLNISEANSENTSSGGSGLDVVMELQFNVESLNSLSFLEKYPSLLKLEANVNNISNFAKLGEKWGKNIESLSLKDNKLGDITGLASAHSIKHVYLDSNQITDLTPIENLPFLVTFTCNSNKLTTFNGFSSRYLSKLELFDNKITEISPKAMNKLSSLTHLDLSRNMIGSINGEMLSMNFLCLQTLILSHNRLADFPSPFCLPMLRTLWISGNKIQYLLTQQQQQHQQQQQAAGGKNSSTHASNSGFFCPLLEKLYIQDNAIREIPSSIGFSCPLLQIADFSFNQIDNASSLLQLRYLNHLHTLQINDNPVTAIANLTFNPNSNLSTLNAAEAATLKLEQERYFGFTFLEFATLVCPSLKILCGSGVSSLLSKYSSSLDDRMKHMSSRQIDLMTYLYPNVNFNPTSCSASSGIEVHSTSLIRMANMAYYMHSLSGHNGFSGSSTGKESTNFDDVGHNYNIQSLFQVLFQMLSGQNNLSVRIKDKEKARASAGSAFYDAKSGTCSSGSSKSIDDSMYEYSPELPDVYVKAAEQIIERRYEDIAYARLIHAQLKRLLLLGSASSSFPSDSDMNEMLLGVQLLSLSSDDEDRTAWVDHFKGKYIRRVITASDYSSNSSFNSSESSRYRIGAATRIQALARGFIVRSRFAKYMSNVAFADSELDDLFAFSGDDDLLDMGNLDLPELADGYLSYCATAARVGGPSHKLGSGSSEDTGDAGGGMVYGDHRRPRSSKQKALLKVALEQQQQQILQQQQQQSSINSAPTNVNVPRLTNAKGNANSSDKPPLTDRSDFSDGLSTGRSESSRFHGQDTTGGSKKPSRPNKSTFAKPMTTTVQSGSFGGKMRTIRKQGNKGKAMPAWALKGNEEVEVEEEEEEFLFSPL